MTREPTWILRAHPRADAKLRLFCLPSAGYGAAMYRAWGSVLPATVEVCAVTLPGREILLGVPPIGELAALVDRVCANLEPALDRPFALFGHSMGAWVAFELAHKLVQRDLRPVHLFVSGRRAPTLPSREAPIHAADDAQLLSEIQRRYGGVPSVVLNEPELLALLLPALRADLKALETYRYEECPPLPCPISCYGGHADAQVPLEDLEAWRGLTAAAFDLQQFEGDHFYLQAAGREPLLAAIDRRLSSYL